MNKSDTVKDERIREFAAQQKINVPISYNNCVLSAINEGKKRNLSLVKSGIYKKIAVACTCIFALTMSCVGVYAAVDYIQRRMDGLTDTEKTHYLDTLNDSLASADTFSRPLSETEKARMDELAIQYKEKGVYPEQNLLEVQDVSEIASDRICFIGSTSTFYLPDTALTDEDILELIDFYCIREYSMDLLQAEEKADVSGIEEIAEENAVEAAETALRKVYNIETDHLEVQIDYQQGADGNETFSTDYISFVNRDTGVSYSVTVDLQNGNVESIEINDEAGIYSESVQADEELYEEKYAEAEQMAKCFLDSDTEWKSSKIIYLIDDKGMLKNGIVNYDFVTRDGKACIVSFSQSLQNMYKVRYFTEEGLIKKEDMDAGKSTEGNFMIIHEVETADVVSLYNNNMVNLREDYFKEMTRNDILDYFGMELDISSIYSDFSEEDDARYGIYEFPDGSTYDRQTFHYQNKDGQVIKIIMQKSKLPMNLLKEMYAQEMGKSKVAGCDVTVLHYISSNGVDTYYAEFVVNDVGVAIKTEGIAIEDFTSILTYVIGWKG